MRVHAAVVMATAPYGVHLPREPMKCVTTATASGTSWRCAQARRTYAWSATRVKGEATRPVCVPMTRTMRPPPTLRVRTQNGATTASSRATLREIVLRTSTAGGVTKPWEPAEECSSSTACSMACSTTTDTLAVGAPPPVAPPPVAWLGDSRFAIAASSPAIWRATAAARQLVVEAATATSVVRKVTLPGHAPRRKLDLRVRR
mmetsp:Transcript_33509/g.94254  ORF Transcript_33509/g.94254 Transcript_33509/m.94254 type:complete len:203 (-) Transcript_33509:3275-3883(-)